MAAPTTKHTIQITYTKSTISNYISVKSVQYIKYIYLMKVKIKQPIFLASIMILFSCSGNHDTGQAAFNINNDRLEDSIKKFRNQNDSLYRIIVTKLQDAKTYKKASEWVPKVELLDKMTTEINNYIMLTVSARAFDSVTNNTVAIYKKLNSYKYAIQRIDTAIYGAAKKSINNITKVFDSVKLNNHAHFNGYLASIPRNERIIILKQALYNILNTNYEIFKFFESKIN